MQSVRIRNNRPSLIVLPDLPPGKVKEFIRGRKGARLVPGVTELPAPYVEWVAEHYVVKVWAKELTKSGRPWIEIEGLGEYTGEDRAEPQKLDNLLAQSVAAAKFYIKSEDDVSTLERWLEAEDTAAPRASIVKAIEGRIMKVTE